MSPRPARAMAMAAALWCGACESSTERPHGESDAAIRSEDPEDEEDDADAQGDDVPDADGAGQAEVDGATDPDATDALDVDAGAQAPIEDASLDAACADCASDGAQSADGMN